MSKTQPIGTYRDLTKRFTEYRRTMKQNLTGGSFNDSDGAFK